MPKTKTKTKAKTTAKTKTKAKADITSRKAVKQQPAKAPKVTEPKQTKKVSRLRGILSGGRFSKAYLYVALGVLLASTVFWAVLAAIIHQGNADQLSDNYLFENYQTFHGALFPDAHTFLLKWPLFIFMKFTGLSPWSFGYFTVLLVLVTVAAFAFLLSRIERRPRILGTWYLALASVLLLVPAQPYPGAILPANMAMITTRNIEYIFYLGSLVLIVRAHRWRDWRLVAAAGVLAILAASDKLFIDMSLAGSVLILVLFALRRNKPLIQLALRWLSVSAVAFAIAAGIAWLIRKTALTHITSTVGAGPFGFIHTAHDLMLGLVYAGFGLLTNFGANPAAHIGILRQVPHEAMQGLATVGAPAFIINLIIFGAGLYGCLRFVLNRRKKSADQAKPEKTDSGVPAADQLSIMLLVTALVGLVMFVVSSHYYPVDARYLTIVMFAVFVTAATYARTRQWPSQKVAVVGVVLLVGVGLGTFSAWHTFTAEKAAMHTITARNQQIVSIMRGRQMKLLIGDYWRVLPVKVAAHDQQLQVMPLSGCAQPADVLSSQAWKPSLKTKRFAYLLSLDASGSLTGFPHCTLQQVINAYGRPDSSIVVDGTPSAPHEIILSYPRGTQGALPARSDAAQGSTQAAADTETILPIQLSALPHTTCPTHAVMNIVAHQDDDLLFINPDTLRAIQAGSCLRNIYVTAGDAGAGSGYWLGREKGAEAAYAEMLGVDNVWTQRTVQLPGGQYVAVANPRHNQYVSLIFMRLPDGNLSGQGFSTTHHVSLARLRAMGTSKATTVDGHSTYTAAEIVGTLEILMDTYKPEVVRTQSTTSPNAIHDHSDHRAVGYLVTSAYEQYSSKQASPLAPLKYYRGYPTRNMEPNILGVDLIVKEKTFLAYAKFDGGVCQTEEECAKPNNNYSAYLRREYEAPN